MTARRSIGTLVGALTLSASLLGAQASLASASYDKTSHHSSGTSYSFQLVADPNDATFTQLLGINDRQQIAGYFGSGQVVSGTLHPNKGFTLSLPNTFSAENYPNSAQTQVIGINNHGDTDGFYVDQAGATHGFIDQGGAFQNVDLPGTTFNQLLGLNNRGQEAGYFQDAQGQNHAYIREPRGAFLVLPLHNSQATGINDAGAVVGFTQPTTTTSNGFVLQGNSLRLLSYPGSTFTQALGENDRGQIVGTYNDAQGTAHGFVYQHGAFQTLDVPGSSGTVVNGINDQGRLVGFFTDAAGNTVGFVATPSRTRVVTLVASLLGKNEASGDPNGGGTVILALDPRRDTISYSIAVGGLQGSVTTAHIHMGAAGVNGPVVVPFLAPTEGSISGGVTASHQQIEAIAHNPAGFYVNVHTTAFPAGAVRGQLMPVSNS